MTARADYYLDPALYDRIYSGFLADVPHVVGLVRGAGGPALEVACGNGRLLLPVLREGLACDGLDLDAGMLGSLRAKLAAEGRTTNLFEADMRDFAIPGRYALIFIAFNSFLHNLTQEDQLATLRRCREHLVPGGRLAIIVFHPSVEKILEFSAADRLVTEGTGEDGGRFRVLDRAEDDRIDQVRRVMRRLEHLDAAGRVIREERMPFHVRYVFKPEMELLLRVAGFARWDVRPLFTDYRDPAGAAGDRAPREGDTLLYTAWKGEA